MAPQAFGTFCGEDGETCALQAAFDAARARGLVGSVDA